MPFVPISIARYIQRCKEVDPSVDVADLRKHLKEALHDHKNGLKCACGNDLWVVGSAYVGNSCFTCITGDSMPDGDFEIDAAMDIQKKTKGRKHMDDILPLGSGGYFDDNGNKINIDLIKKPNLCLRCIHDDDPHEEIMCNLTRCDQDGEKEFVCHHFRRRSV